MDKANITDAILFFPRVFSVVLALALTESFKQFIADRAAERGDRVVHWDRLPALIAFLVLVFPFYQGMSRYFFTTYGNLDVLPKPYSASLMFDGIAFTCESALFFVMSRALSPSQWWRYNITVLVLLLIDSIWGVLANLIHGTPIESWIILNFVFAFLSH